MSARPFFLTEHERAETPEDILERRTKQGLHLDAAGRAAFETWLAGQGAASTSPIFALLGGWG